METNTEIEYQATNQGELDVCYVMRKAVSDAFCEKLIEEYSKPEVEKEQPFIGQGKDSEKNINLDIRFR
jgi:hypothetical protein